ncbi:MAG: DUF551 domain-containing protein [Bilifractor sp.]
MRTIDADHLIKYINGRMKNNELMGWSGRAEEDNKLVQMIQNAPTVPQPGTWISVKNRLPKFGELVIMCLDFHRGQSDDGYLVTADILNADKYGYYLEGVDPFAFGRDFDLVYWMPLPESPEEGRANELSG